MIDDGQVVALTRKQETLRRESSRGLRCEQVVERKQVVKRLSRMVLIPPQKVTSRQVHFRKRESCRVERVCLSELYARALSILMHADAKLHSVEFASSREP